jgi:hypothetical protein
LKIPKACGRFLIYLFSKPVPRGKRLSLARMKKAAVPAGYMWDKNTSNSALISLSHFK